MPFVSWEDIVVGAPQYFEKDGEIGGAVYVYVNKAGRWSEVTPTRINGAQNSMFGMAVENLGDINLDGFNGEAATCLRTLHMYTTVSRSVLMPLIDLYSNTVSHCFCSCCQILQWELLLIMMV